MTEKEELEMLAQAGAFDCVALLQCEDKKYESKGHPGWIEAIESDFPGKFHPLDDDGLPIFSVLLNENGRVIS